MAEVAIQTKAFCDPGIRLVPFWGGVRRVFLGFERVGGELG